MDTSVTLLILVAVITITALIYFKLNLKKSTKSLWKNEVRQKLTEIENRKDNSNIESLKSTIIELDKLLDHSFKKKGLRGETMADRLKNAKSLYDYNLYNNIWNAHKTRNQIAHEISLNLSINQANQSISTLKSAISKLV